MTNLMCNAHNCAHNQSNLCCKDSIQIAGDQAVSSTATCCNSFEEKTGAFTSSYEQPKSRLSIQCNAVNCFYNEAKMCSAETISIDGMNACATPQTECSSFVPKF